MSERKLIPGPDSHSNPIDKAEIVIYQAPDNQTNLEVRFEEETIWLTQPQIISLFSSSKANVSEHIKHIYQSQELEKKATVRKFRTVQIEGARKVFRQIDHYNLDMIISIGYRINTIRGTQFRIWANKILKEYLLKGYVVNQRFEKIEKDLNHLKIKVDEVDFQIRTNLPLKEGIFFDGQIFDAYHFVSGLIKSAEKSLVLIDNYIDESVLILLSKRKPEVAATIYTASISTQLELDIERFNSQYPKIDVKKFKTSHDRFLIIDQHKVYHIGASQKTLAKNGLHSQ